MKLLISTPCAGGMLYEGYVSSLLSTIERAKDEGLCEAIQIHFQGKESLIHRARNRAALFALEGGFDKLLTIDADIAWKYEDFKRLVSSTQPIVGGVYPLKTFPVVMNFNAIEGRGTEFLSSERGYDLDAYEKFRTKYAGSDGLVEVNHLATGFLCVSVEVLAKLSHTCEVYFSRQNDTGETKGFFDLYPSKVIEKVLESEDWGFCRLAREAGYPIFLDTRVTLSHIGNWTFKLGQFYGTSSNPNEQSK